MSNYKISDKYSLNSENVEVQLPVRYRHQSSAKGDRHPRSRSLSLHSLGFQHLKSVEISEASKSPLVKLAPGSSECCQINQTLKGQLLVYDNIYGYKDQYDIIGKHTEKGIEFLDRYVNFLKKRCDIENSYASELKKLVRAFHSRQDDEESQFSYAQGFQDMLKEVHDMAGQHEVAAEKTQSQLILDIQKCIVDFRNNRKKFLQEGTKIQNQMKESLKCLENTKKNYEKKFNDAERALEAFRKADANINLSRADVARTHAISNKKSQEAEDSKNEYASQLKSTNQFQKDYYTVLMPSVFKQLQDLDESRINKIKFAINQSGNIEAEVIPIITTCIQGIHLAAKSISAEQDSKIVIDRYKTGFEIPADIPFEDLVNPNPVNNRSNSLKTVVPDGNKLPSKGSSASLSGGKKKDKKGLFGIFGKPANADEQSEDFSYMPPAQRKVRLTKKIDEIQAKIAYETAEREGMIKMAEVYKINPLLGDSSSVDTKLQLNAEKLNTFKAELKKYQDYLSDAEGNMNANLGLTRQNSNNSMTLSVTSDSSIHSTAPVLPTQYLVQEEFYEPVQILPRGTTNEPVVEFNQDEFIYTVIGSCRAVYPFDASNASSMSMSENEEMWILEHDQGDGWTRVRKEDNTEGFVPTSYIQCHFYDQNVV